MHVHPSRRSLLAGLIVGAMLCVPAAARAAQTANTHHTQLAGDAYFTDSASGDFVAFFATNGTWDIETGQQLSGPTVSIYVQYPDGTALATENPRNVTFHVRPRLKTSTPPQPSP